MFLESYRPLVSPTLIHILVMLHFEIISLKANGHL